jgi:hypothetical protein
MWGNQYDRLYGIKTRIDPNRVFWVTPGVGADDFNFENGRLCRTAASTQTTPRWRPKSFRPRPNALNPLAQAPQSDNRNFKGAAGSAYKDFPKSQEDADKEK